MVAIAKKLGAKVVGPDGEVYGLRGKKVVKVGTLD